MRPRVGWFQRTSASAASARSDTAEKIGWYSTVSSPSRSAFDKAAANSVRTRALDRSWLVNIAVPARPATLAAWTAVSANEIIWIAPSSGGAERSSASEMLTPTLTETSSSSWRIVSRPVSARRTRSARSIATAPSVTSWHSTMNSSPPRRATMSSGRTAVVSRFAVDASRRSPTSWPSASLTSRRRSTSIISTAISPPTCAARRNRVGDPFERRRAVEQTGRRIVLEEMHQLDRAHPLVGDVAAEDADEAARGRQRIVANEDRAGLDAGRAARPRQIDLAAPHAAFGIEQQLLRHLVEHVAQRRMRRPRSASAKRRQPNSAAPAALASIGVPSMPMITVAASSAASSSRSCASTSGAPEPPWPADACGVSVCSGVIEGSWWSRCVRSICRGAAISRTGHTCPRPSSRGWRSD